MYMNTVWHLLKQFSVTDKVIEFGS